MVTTQLTKISSVIPCLRYRDARAAIDWLVEAFGLIEAMVAEGPDGVINHAELTWDNGMVMLGSEPQADEPGRLSWPSGAGSVYVIVDDPDAHHERAVAAGAEIVLPLKDEDYGSRGYTARDPEGNLWSFGTYRPEPPAG
ncbi:MAG TPA: VOC family protein [Pseudonocardiaceae bacterium]|jgi:uncharacterized glyoxalase superfamily protein PhnB